MKEIDFDKIFGLFEIDDKEIFLQFGLTELMEDDRYLLQAGIKGLENYWLLDKIEMNKGKLHLKRYEAVREVIKKKYYLKMFSYIDRVNLNRIEPIYDVVEELGYGTVERSLKELRQYFIELEYYEKCAKLTKMINIITNLFYPENI